MNRLLTHGIKAKSVLRATFVFEWQVAQSNPKRMSRVFLVGNPQPRQPCVVRNYVTALNFCVKRGCATKSSRKTIPKRFQKQLLPFETGTSAASDVLLFSFHQRERLCFLITLGGIFFFCVLLNSSELIYITLNRVKPTSSNTNGYPWYYWWKYINFNSNFVKYGASGFVFIFGKYDNVLIVFLHAFILQVLSTFIHHTNWQTATWVPYQYLHVEEHGNRERISLLTGFEPVTSGDVQSSPGPQCLLNVLRSKHRSSQYRTRESLRLYFVKFHLREYITLSISDKAERLLQHKLVLFTYSTMSKFYC